MKIIIKRLGTFITVALLLCMVAGCGGSPRTTSKNEPKKTKEATDVEGDAKGSSPTVLTDCPGYDFENLERYPGSKRVTFERNKIEYTTSDSVKDVARYYGNILLSRPDWQIIESGETKSTFGIQQNGWTTTTLKAINNIERPDTTIQIFIDASSQPVLAKLKTTDPTLDLSNYRVSESTQNMGEDVLGEDPPELRPPNSTRIAYEPDISVEYESSEPRGYFAAWYVSKGYQLDHTWESEIRLSRETSPGSVTVEEKDGSHITIGNT